MLDSGTKPPENRIHLFDPVGLINDGYGGTYRSSSYAVRPRRPTKSYGNFEEVATNGGLKSYDTFNNNIDAPKGVGVIRSYDSFTDSNNPGLRSYDSFSMETKAIINIDDHVNGLEVGFGIDNDNVVLDDNDVCTPRLWKPTSPTSPKSLNSSYFQPTNNVNNNSTNATNNTSIFHPRNSKSLQMNPTSPRHANYPQNMSPSSRTQAIAKGRKELMDMVRDLPESFYELSLKDIVEKKVEFGVPKGVIDIHDEKKSIKENVKENGASPLEKKKSKKKGKKMKKSESKKKMVRTKAGENKRFLLRTSVFPIFSRSKKNKKRLGGANSFKIAPMPKQNPSSSGSMKVVEKDWWRKKSCMYSEGDDNNGLNNKSASSGGSSSSTSRSSSLNGRQSSRFLPSCCLFNGRSIRSKK